MSAKAFDVAVVGEIYVDHVFSGFEAWPTPGQEITTEAYVREVGGGTATTACALGRLGRKATVIGAIGAIDRDWIARRLAQFNVSASGLAFADSGYTGVTVSISTRVDRSFFTHIGVNAKLADLLITPAAIAEMQRASHVHFAMPLARATADILLPRLAAAGCTTSLDVGCQPVWLRDAANDLTLSRVDYFLPNEIEAEMWSGGAGEEAFFARAERAGLTNPTIKLGVHGAAAKAGNRCCRAAPPAVTVADTTGAGDAFDAGFIDALLDAESPENRLRRACVVGALSTRAAGGLGALPNREEEKAHYELASVR
jgi:sugar/nucleoside kinase (ribokinase family)